MFKTMVWTSSQKLLCVKFLHSVRWNATSSQTRLAFTNPKIKDFTGENIVITGGTNELGQELALRLASLNATVIIWDSNQEALNMVTNLVRLIDGRIFPYSCNLSCKEDIYRVADKTRQEVGQVSIVINNTDTAAEKPFLETPDTVIEKTFNINILSHFWTTKALLPDMIEANQGHIVTICSMASHMGIHKLTDYCATKSAALGFITALRSELDRNESNGVKTTLICPYFMKSSIFSKTASLRLIQPLDVHRVADRSVEAIKRQENMVFIPNWFKFALMPRWITPSPISSLLNRLLIKDVCPAESTGINEELHLPDLIKSATPINVRKSVSINAMPETQKTTPASPDTIVPNIEKVEAQKAQKAES